MEFKLPNCILRPLRMSDAESIATNGNNIAIANNMRDRFPSPYYLENAEAFISLMLSPENKDMVNAIEVDGKAVGIISILFKEDVHRLSAEIGYWLGETHWGKGIATEAVKALVDYAFENTDLVRIYGIMFSPNKASAAVLENAGFRFEGTQQKAIYKNGEILDALVYAMVK
jgi:[ribosomal protein S5]-alanine N-acetyltransferase